MEQPDQHLLDELQETWKWSVEAGLMQEAGVPTILCDIPTSVGWERACRRADRLWDLVREGADLPEAERAYLSWRRHPAEDDRLSFVVVADVRHLARAIMAASGDAFGERIGPKVLWIDCWSDRY